MVQQLVETAPTLADYLDDYLNDPQITQEMFRIGWEGYAGQGRGVVVVDVRRFAESIVRFYYLSSGSDGWQDAEMARIADGYSPSQEVIVYLYHGEAHPHNDCFKLAVQSC
ncbi:MAG: hypothetical protein KDI62_20930 [Anaerolineae bacterium]|nr:hypothetical protein [Anaerolineae bacterium]MCB9108695.1 hypothetical protein [Anaerolineales bacterium]